MTIKVAHYQPSRTRQIMGVPITLLVLSCGRPALLSVTLSTLFSILPAETFTDFRLLDCRDNITRAGFQVVPACKLSAREADIMCNVDRLYQSATTTFVLFTEDDWQFTNPTLLTDLEDISTLLWKHRRATTVQLTGKNTPIYYNKTRGLHRHGKIIWAWTNSPAGPNGMFGAWTNNPHIGRAAIRPADLKHEGRSSMKFHAAGYSNIQTMASYVSHIGQGAHVYKKSA